MIWADHDSATEFRAAFLAEIDSDSTRSGVAPEEFRAGGRVSKAFPNKEDASWWQANGPEMVDAWISWRKSLPNWQIWETPAHEPAIELELNGTIGETPVKAFLDRIFIDTNTGELSVVDLKTGSREPDNPLQLGFYKVLVQKCLGVEVNTGYYWMSRKGGLGQAHDLTRFNEHLIGSMLKQFEKAIESEVFIPHLTSMCGTCGVRRGCYAAGGEEAKRYDVLHPEYKPVFTTEKEGK